MIGMQSLTGALRVEGWSSTSGVSAGLGGLALVVADGPMQAGPWRTLLRAQGFRVRVRYGGHEGLDALEQEAPVLLVLDLWRGGMDSLSFLKVARTLHADLGVPAFVRAPTTPVQLRELLERAGADEVLDDTPDAPALRGLLARHRLVDTLRDGLLPSGTRVADRFVIDGLIGRGATAAVYRATDLELRDQVALKVLDCADALPGGVERFRQEMRICRRLQHANIVRPFDYGVWQGQPFFTMELLRGQTLRGFLRERGRRPVAVSVGVPLVVQACRGLSLAHDLGVVHRDIKPDNLFVLDGERQLKVMDFGIAKSSEPSAAASTHNLVLGTPGYVAPERIVGDGPARPASDVFALGVVLFELFTGRPPFAAPALPDLLMQVVEAPTPDPSELNPALPEGIADVIRACLAKDPADRPADARALERRLTDAVQLLPV